MIIPFGFLKQPVSGVAPLYDGVSAMYTLRTPDMTTLWTNAVLKIRRSSDNATAFVFVDGSAKDDTITLSSLISTTSDTTPDATDLTTWIGANAGWVERWYAITPDNIISTGKRAIMTTTSLQPKIVAAGAILLKNSLPAIKFLSSTKYIQTAAGQADMDSGNDFTFFTVSWSDDSGLTNLQAIISSRISTGGVSDRFLISNDRRTNKLIARIRSDGSTNYDLTLISQTNSANQRQITVVVDGTTPDFEAFLNGTTQDSDTQADDYANTGLKFGADLINSNPLNGGIQEVILIADKDLSDQSTIESNQDSYYSIP